MSKPALSTTCLTALALVAAVPVLAQADTTLAGESAAELATAVAAPADSALVAGPVEAAAPPPPEGDPQVIDRVIATVGGELLLLSELQEQLSLLASQQGVAVTDEVQCNVLEQLLTGKLLVNQARLDSVEVTDADVEGQLDARLDRILGLMNGDLRQFEEYYGQTVSEVRAQFREDLRDQLYSERMRAQIVAEAEMTPSEVKAFFESIPADSLPYFNSEVEYRELVYEPKVNPEQRAIALAQIEEIRRRLVEEGADFAELARKRSDDPGSGRAGGELGWAPRGTFVPEFEAAAYRLEVDEISEVVESPFGFHVIQLEERRGNRVRTRHILIKPEIVAEDLALAERVLDSVRALVVSDSLLFREAVTRVGSDKTQSYTNGGRVSNPADGSTIFEIGDLDPVAFFAIDTLEVGEVTAPVLFESPTGEVTYKLFQLDSRTTPHKASLRRDYNRIRTAAVESKKAEILSDWVEATIGATFVKVDPSLVRRCGLEGRWLMGSVAARP